MNPNPPSDSWSRLTAAARAVPDNRPTAAPFGFSTRLAALAVSAERVKASLLDQFALRAVSFACLLALGSILVNFSALKADNRDGVAVEDDLVSVLLAE